MKNVCIVSGGGSWGAYTVGKLKALNNEYDLAVGSSTGALIAPFAILGEWDKLEDLYTTITYDDIFNVNPFKKNGKINFLKVIWRIIGGKLTLGENINLYNLIKKHFTIDMYEEIRVSNKDVIITVCDITNKETKYISIQNYSYEDFCKYMWASASFPFICSVVEIDGNKYIDGGTLENSPLDCVLTKDVSKIDIFSHNAKTGEGDVKSIIDFVIRIVEMMRGEIVRNDLNGLKGEKIKSIDLKIYDLIKQPEKSYLTFDPNYMKKWFDEGFDSIMLKR